MGVKEVDTVIILGCGPIGLLAQKFSWLKGAKRVIAVDYVNYRLEHAKRTNKVETINFEQEENIGTYLKEITQGGERYTNIITYGDGWNIGSSLLTWFLS